MNKPRSQYRDNINRPLPRVLQQLQRKQWIGRIIYLTLLIFTVSNNVYIFDYEYSGDSALRLIQFLHRYSEVMHRFSLGSVQLSNLIN